MMANTSKKNYNSCKEFIYVFRGKLKGLYIIWSNPMESRKTNLNFIDRTKHRDAHMLLDLSICPPIFDMESEIANIFVELFVNHREQNSLNKTIFEMYASMCAVSQYLPKLHFFRHNLKLPVILRQGQWSPSQYTILTRSQRDWEELFSLNSARTEMDGKLLS